MNKRKLAASIVDRSLEDLESDWDELKFEWESDPDDPNPDLMGDMISAIYDRYSDELDELDEELYDLVADFVYEEFHGLHTPRDYAEDFHADG